MNSTVTGQKNSRQSASTTHRGLWMSISTLGLLGKLQEVLTPVIEGSYNSLFSSGDLPKPGLVVELSVGLTAGKATA